jgi:DNA polymerase III alpha subunit
MAALLSSAIGDTDKVVPYIAECRALGIEVLPPDVNESGWHFTVIGDRRIRFGLGAVKNLGPFCFCPVHFDIVNKEAVFTAEGLAVLLNYEDGE